MPTDPNDPTCLACPPDCRECSRDESDCECYTHQDDHPDDQGDPHTHQLDTPTRHRVVVLCGSTRFKSEFEQANRNLTLAGHIVLAPGVFGHAVGVMPTEEQKAALDALHFRKIDFADEVYVINPGGYVGDSTRNEIAYAERTGKPIFYLSPDATPQRATFNINKDA